MQEIKFELGKFIRDYPHGRSSSALIKAVKWLSVNCLNKDWSKFDFPDYLGAPEEIFSQLEAEELDYITAWGNLYKSNVKKVKKVVHEPIDPIEQLVLAAGLSYKGNEEDLEADHIDDFYD